MGSLKRKSRESDSMEDERLERRLKRRCRARSRQKVDWMGACGGSSAKPAATRTRGNVPTWGTTNDDRDYPPDDDYMKFLNGLGLGFSSAADSDRGVGGNSARDSEAATRNVGSGLKGVCPGDYDIDLFKFLIEKDGGSSSIREDNNGVDNNEDAGATNGCGMSVDSGDEAARYVDDSFLRAGCSSDRNGWSPKPGDDDNPVDSFDSKFVEEAANIEGSANSSDDDMAVDSFHVESEFGEKEKDIEATAKSGDNDKSVNSFHVESEFVEEEKDIEGCANSGDSDNAVDKYFDNAAIAEEVTDHCNNVHSDPSDRDQTADDDMVETSDPLYGRFLASMRADGNHFNVELPVSSGQSLFLVYEKQDVSRGQCDAGETRQTSLQRNNGEPEIRLGQGCNETQGHCQIRDEGDTGCDPRIPNGSNKSSLMVRYKTRTGLCTVVRREERSQMEDRLEIESKRKGKERSDPMPAKIQLKTGNTRTKKVSAPSLVRDRRTETVPCPSEQIMKAQKDVSNMQDRKRRRLISEVKQRKESLNPIPREEPATTKAPSNNNRQCRPKMEQHDKCYEAFLSSLEKKPTHVEFVPSVGEKVAYHDYPSSPADSDVVEIDAATFANDVNNPFVTTKNHEVIDLDLEPEEGHCGNYNNSVFRLKLLEILRKPYDEKEYEALFKEVSCGKQLVKDKELRHGRTVTVKLKGFARSYLDNHKDFAKMLKELKPDSACNLPKRLNLLRGFVYWLENVPLSGSFKPWLDESCLKMLPSAKLQASSL